MKNVLVLGDSVYPDSMGGSHRHIYDLCRLLSEKGYKVTIITPNKDGDFLEYENLDNINIYRFYRNSKNLFKSFIDYLIGPYMIYKRLLRSGNKFDVIHGHWPLTNLLIFNKEKNNANVKKIYTFHGPMYEEYSYEFQFKNNLLKKMVLLLLRNIEKCILIYCNEIIVASNYMKDKINSIYQISNKINIIPVGTDTKKFKPIFKNKKMAKDKINMPKDKIMILSIRRLQKRMGLENLIKAFYIVNKEYPNTYLIIGGQGKYKDELIKLVNDLNLEKEVKFVGFIKEEQISTYYEAADLFVMPSISLEGFGLSTAEAMLNGTLVIATPVGANTEIINKYNAELLTQSISPENIAKTLNYIINKNNRRFTYNNDCREFIINNYSWEKVINQIIGLYES